MTADEYKWMMWYRYRYGVDHLYAITWAALRHCILEGAK